MLIWDTVTGVSANWGGTAQHSWPRRFHRVLLNATENATIRSGDVVRVNSEFAQEQFWLAFPSSRGGGPPTVVAGEHQPHGMIIIVLLSKRALLVSLVQYPIGNVLAGNHGERSTRWSRPRSRDGASRYCAALGRATQGTSVPSAVVSRPVVYRLRMRVRPGIPRWGGGRRMAP